MNVVDQQAAAAARGVRIVSSAVVPSPWSEAAKAVFAIAGVPVAIVRAFPRDPAIFAWTRSHNVPVVFHDDEPPRTVWSQIVALAARLGDHVVPASLAKRTATFGWLNELAGEGGLGWNGRLLMIHASLASGGTRGFSLQAAQYLGGKYGYAADRIAAARERSIEILDGLGARLGDAPYFGGDRPDALDAYAATFLTPALPIAEADCPALQPALRAAFGTAAEELAGRVPPALIAHRTRMFEQHLEWPIPL